MSRRSNPPGELLPEIYWARRPDEIQSETYRTRLLLVKAQWASNPSSQSESVPHQDLERQQEYQAGRNPLSAARTLTYGRSRAWRKA